MNGQDATTEIIHQILTHRSLYEALTQEPYREELHKERDSIVEQIITQNITSEDAIKVAKALCKVCDFMSEKVCPIVEKL